MKRVRTEIIKYKNVLKVSYLLVAALTASVFFNAGCKHEVPQPVAFGNGDTTNGGNNGGGNNGGGNNGGGNGIACDPDSIYFQQDILPFLITNCAKSGCHDANSAQDGVVLNSYSNVVNTGDVSAFDLDNSEIWEVINETDPDKVMPPPGENELIQEQIDMIAEWINQGALNLVCDDGLSGCDSTSVSYLSDITPIIQNKCIGCHGSGHSGNAFINLSNYTGVSASAATNHLVGAITHSTGFTAMPLNGPMLTNCEIGEIRNWVNSGYPNN